MDAVRTVEDEVREIIRRSGLDPSREPAAVQRLVHEAVTDYEERSIQGGMPLIASVNHVAKEVWDSVAGLGPLQKYLDDPEIEEIWINGRLNPGLPSRVRIMVGRPNKRAPPSALTHQRCPRSCYRRIM